MTRKPIVFYDYTVEERIDRIERALRRLVENGHNPVSSAKATLKILDGEEPED